MSATKSLADWLQSAYESREGCPPPETYLSGELAAVAPGERRALEEHAESCPACAAERELARAFESPREASEAERRSVGAIVRRLERRSPARGGIGRLLRLPGFGAGPAARGVGLAAAAVLVLAVGFAVQSWRSAPPLPEPVVDDVLRSSELEAVSPRGEIAGPPQRLEWEPVEGAAGYRVEIRAIDDEVLWEAAASGPSASPPDELRQRLRPHVAYLWTVEALDDGGARIAWSPPVSFEILAGERGE